VLFSHDRYFSFIMNIIKDINLLRQPCRPVEDISDGLSIGKQLLKVLCSTDNGVGLAANQIGIYKRVCVVHVLEPLILINPKIASGFKKINYKEACLSFPGTYINTVRFANVIVTADNHKAPLLFSEEKSLLECVCVQHEIDHLNSITMFERELKEKDIGEQE
jgi:peptide deformylase